MKEKQARRKKQFGAEEEKSLSLVHWTDAATDSILEMVDAVTDAGGAVMLTRSQDGGTLGIRVYHDDYDLKTYWARPGEEMDALVATITGEMIP